ncbi:MAG: PAS domain S-box protein [Nitrospiria bacterium]
MSNQADINDNLRKKSDLLDAILEESSDVIIIKDLQRRYLLVNSVGARNFGKTPDEIIGKTNEELSIFPDVLKEIDQSEQKVIVTGEPISCEFSPAIDGVRRTFLSTKSPYRNKKGEIIGVIDISRDITSRKSEEERVRAEHAYRKPIEEAMLAGVAAVDFTGKLIYVNAAFCKMVGWTEQQLLGKIPPYPYWVPEEIKKNLDSVNSRIVSKNTSEFKTEFQRQNGERFFVLIKTAPLTDGYGKEIGFVATVSDISVQKSVENKMQESYQLLQSIIDGTTDAIYLRDLEGRYIMMNYNGAKIFKKSPAEFIGKDLSELFPSDFVQKTKEADQRTLKTGKTETIENRVIINGNELIFLTTRGPIRNAQNDIVGFFGISRDITERIIAENRLKSEYAFRKAIEHSMIAGVAAVDKNGRMIYVNPAFCQMTGWSEKELLGSTPPFVYWPPEEIQNIMSSFKDRLQKGISAEGEMILRRKTEERFPVLILRSPLKDADGNNLGLLASFYDLSERKRSEQALLQANQILERFVNACPLSIMVFDSAGIVKMVNPATEQMFGWSKDELIGRFNLIVPEEKRVEFLANINSVIGGKTIIGLEARRKKRSGDPIDLNLWAVSFLDENGNPCVLSISADITEKRKMENEILKIQKLESLGVLAGGIAHDFNNILTGIIGNISLAKILLNPKDEVYDLLGHAESASERATHLSSQLLTFAKGSTPVKKIVSLQKLLEENVPFILVGSNVKAELKIQEALWGAEIDEGQISQVIQNLVINAQQAMPGGGTIQVKAMNFEVNEENKNIPLRKGNYVEISVQDKGVGISKEHLGKIFDPYFTTKSKGSGLGLSISHSIIQRHNGLITVQSVSGVGSTFYVYLPAVPEAIIGQKSSREDIITGKGRVLVVDDEEIIREMIGPMLRQLGYEAVTASSGIEGIAEFQKSMETGDRFDAVITDLTLQGELGGIEVLSILKTIDPGIKVVVSSGYSNDPVMSGFENYGFSNFISKPYRVSELGRTLNKVLKGS